MLAADLPFKQFPKLRFEGEANDFPIAAAWQPAQGRHFAMLPKSLLKETGLKPGDAVHLRFRVADQDAVDLPDEIADALLTDAAFAALWNSLTTGRKRGFSIWVGDAKSAEVRQRRLKALIEGLHDDPGLTPIRLSWKDRAARKAAKEAAPTETPSR
ncbi:MAG: YdeI/OmpD-associated family protein [Rhizobiaceae bacterium]|nr:YdeI/OmpD-associated family protein [Rhizobiaceae bacterium]